MSVESLAQALLEAGILDASTVEAKASRARNGRQLLESIVLEGDLPEPQLVNQLARALSVPRYDPKERQPEAEAAALLDARQSDELGVLPVAVRGGGMLLWVAMCDPTDEQLQAEVSRRTGRRVKACLVGPRELQRALLAMNGAANAAANPQPAANTAYAPPAYPGAPAVPAMPLNYPGVAPMMANGMATMGLAPMPGQPYPYPYGALPPTMMGAIPGPVAAGKTAEQQKLEDELAQAKQVIKVLTQLLVERGVLDGEELKRRLRAERERR